MLPPATISLVKIQASSAAEVCARFNAPGEVKQLLREGMSPAQLLAALVEQKKFVPAIDFLAHALPPRECIWWGCLCLQHALGDGMSPPDKAAAKAAVQWIMNPSEATRAAAQAPSEAAPPPSIAGALARAAFQTGTNLTPASVASAIKLASVKTEPANIAKTQRSYLELGIEVAQGRFL